MKKILFAVAAVALLSSCAKEVINTNDDAPEVQLSVNSLGTRAITALEDGKFVTTLQKGDLVGVHLLYGKVGESPVYDPMNVKYKVSTNGKLISLGKPIKLPKGEGYSIVAYYPYKDNYDPAYEKKFFTVRQDQTSKEDFELSNFMNATISNVTAANPSMDLVFSSRVAFVSLTVENSENLENAFIKVYLTGGMAFVNGSITFITEGEKAYVTMHKLENGLYGAFVPAQSVIPGTELFKLAYSDGTEVSIPATSPILMSTASVTPLLIGKNHNLCNKHDLGNHNGSN